MASTVTLTIYILWTQYFRKIFYCKVLLGRLSNMALYSHIYMLHILVFNLWVRKNDGPELLLTNIFFSTFLSSGFVDNIITRSFLLGSFSFWCGQLASGLILFILLLCSLSLTNSDFFLGLLCWNLGRKTLHFTIDALTFLGFLCLLNYYTHFVL